MTILVGWGNDYTKNEQTPNTAKASCSSSWKNLYTTEALTFNNISTKLCVLIKYDLGLWEGYKSINSYEMKYVDHKGLDSNQMTKKLVPALIDSNQCY